MALDSEDEIKKALNIDSWRNLSKDKVVKFAAMMPDMGADVAMKIIEQFPKFKEFAVDTLNVLEREHGSTLDSNARSQERVHAAYQEIREVLKGQLEREDLSADDRRFLIEQLMETGEKESERDTENKQFLDGLFQKVLVGAGAVVAAGLVFVGGKIMVERGGIPRA
ncbi:hypothetical protein ACFYMB_18705 [Micromonospora haikouensis]|uniref:hypothetical protein n=1 Tax=Micromonospora haikouensis TaxID=686309 RepID=UPI003688D65A